VLQSVLEKAEPELSLLELDARRLFILCTVEANAFPAEAEHNFSDQETGRERLLTAAGEKGDLRRYRLTITPAGIKARDKGLKPLTEYSAPLLTV
jgi:hypothetical protein